jgi:hypothetical protein
MSAVGVRSFSLENEKYREKLTRQAIHMDQGVCYNPEYLATRSMSMYPSRVAQIVRAVLLGELAPSARGAEIVFGSILSAQGERWQNFSEDQSDFLHCAILGRELFVNGGFPGVRSKGDLEIPSRPERENLWAESIEVRGGDCFLFVDDASFEYTGKAPKKLGSFLRSAGVSLRGYSSSSTGFALFAHGLVDDGIARLRDLVDELGATGASKILTVSGQATYALTTLADELGISRSFDVVDVLDVAGSIETQKAYVYGGSFYTRYLRKSARLAELTRNSYERPVPNSPEFLPLYDADRRINGLNLWGSPIAPEYVNKHTPGGVLEKIRDAACDEIARSAASRLVICEPFAYNELSRIGRLKGAEYFWSLLA